jgi:uncharacterized protein
MKLPKDGLGLGLRPELYAAIDSARPSLDFLEVISENYLEPGSLARERLRRVRKDYQVVLHGVSLNLLGTDALDLEYLSAVKELALELDAPYVTDHLCWTAHRGVQHHDLLPSPCSSELVPYAVERAAFVQDFLGVPFGIENLSSYVTFGASNLDEWEFYCQIAEQADCGLLLDVNNIHVSAKNHGFSAHAYLERIPWQRVLQVHLAGHRILPSGLVHDTHDCAVSPEVWELYATAWRLGGPFPTLLEWDADIPPLGELVSVLDRARAVRGG